MKLPKQLSERIQAGRLPGGLILTGESRGELARVLAMAYLCQGRPRPCGSCRHCRKAEAGIHPDFITIGKAGESLKVDDIRAMRKDAYIRPNEAERKVYLLEQAETMNQSGQNALLKLLEDGPAYGAFLFLAPNPEQLLPTLRSRCETIRYEGEAQETQQSQEAETFVRLICDAAAGLKLMEFCVSLEKKSREELRTLFDQSIALLVQAQEGQTESLLPKLNGLQDIRAACETNIGSGHVAGWLIAVLT